jgi:hypothetical protein
LTEFVVWKSNGGPMKFLSLFLPLLLFLSLFLSPQLNLPLSGSLGDIVYAQTTGNPSPSGSEGVLPGEDEWRHKMHSFKMILNELLPYTVNIEAFNAAENAVLIQNSVNKLTATSQSLNHRKLSVTSDPTISYVAAAFEDNLGAVTENLKKGRRDYGRYLLLNTLSYCIECHTRTNEPPEFFSKLEDASFQKLNPIEQVEYLVAMRHFSNALALIERILEQDLPENLTLGAEKLIQYGLTVSVKFNQDSKKALALIEKIEKAKNVPYFLKKDAAHWKSSVLNWQKFEMKAKKKGKAEPKDILISAEALIKDGSSLNSKNSSLHAGDICFLRANSMLLQLLKQNLSNEIVAQTLLLIGETYEAMTGNLFWSLHQYYYEACARQLPHSVIAGKCFKKFETSVYSEYSGGSGTYLPTHAVKKIKELKALSR